MKKQCFLIILLTFFLQNGFAQNAGNNNQAVYTLSPLLSVTPKIYVLNESDLRKYQLPQNYMMVKNPSKETVTLWEFPDEFPMNKTNQLPAAIPDDRSTRTVPDKQKATHEQKPLTEPGQMTDLLKSLGLGSGKEISISDLNQLLPIANKK
jgi:hypothetical protein